MIVVLILDISIYGYHQHVGFLACYREICIYIYICIYTHIRVYMHIDREIYTERERDIHRERYILSVSVHMLYIYICNVNGLCYHVITSCSDLGMSFTC